jgi:hypothetical protein
MMVSFDRNGNIIQQSPEWADTRRAEMVEDNHLALQEYPKASLKNLMKLRKQNALREQKAAIAYRKAMIAKRNAAKAKAINDYRERKRREALNNKYRALKSGLLEQAMNQPSLGFDFSPTMGNPFIDFSAPTTPVKSAELVGEGLGRVFEAEEFGVNTLLRADYLDDNSLEGLFDNPFKTVSGAVNAVIEIGGKMYDVGSSAARQAIRVVDEEITGGKIADIMDDADQTIKTIEGSTKERVADIGANADLTSDGIIASAKLEAAGIMRGEIGKGMPMLTDTALEATERTYYDTEEAWFDTKEGLEETGAGRTMLKTGEIGITPADPGYFIGHQDKFLRKTPVIKGVYADIELYSGGLSKRVVSASTMPGKLVRGQAGLQLTDERVSKAEFIQNMVFYAQVALMVLTAGAAGGVIILIASNMKNGPLGETEEGRKILTLAQVAAIAYSGGTSSIANTATTYAAQEAQRKAAEKATEEVAKRVGMGATSQAMLQAALSSGDYSQAAVAAGRVYGKSVIVQEASKKTGTTGGLLTSMALEATWATAGAPNMNEKGQTPSNSEIFQQSMKQQIIGQSQKRAIGMAAFQARERVGGDVGNVLVMGSEEVILASTEAASAGKAEAEKGTRKTLPKAQADALVTSGEIGYSAYETDQSFSDKMQKALKEKSYDKVIVMADKKQNALITKQRKKVNEAMKKPEEMRQEAIDKVAETENQIYDLQVARDHALEQAELAPQRIQDQLTENANALQTKISEVPNAAKSKAEREATALEEKARRAEAMVERNKKIVEHFNATEALGKQIHEMGEEAKKLRFDSQGASFELTEDMLRKAIEIEMQMIEMYMMLQMMEQRAVDMSYEASVLDAQDGIYYAAAQEGRHVSYLYDYRHPMITYGLLA